MDLVEDACKSEHQGRETNGAEDGGRERWFAVISICRQLNNVTHDPNSACCVEVEVAEDATATVTVEQVCCDREKRSVKHQLDDREGRVV